MTREELIEKYKKMYQERNDEPTWDDETFAIKCVQLSVYEECIEDLEALKQPEIVRCGECKNNNKYTICDWLNGDDFCSWGERRTE